MGSDDFHLRVFNYNTSEKITAFEAHPDYIRSIIVHPTQPFVLTASDDMTIKLWNWDAGWKCQQTFEGHSHYVMCLAINPKDTNTFASACLDRTVKIWSLGGSGSANFTLEAHETKGAYLRGLVVIVGSMEWLLEKDIQRGRTVCGIAFSGVDYL